MLTAVQNDILIMVLVPLYFRRSTNIGQLHCASNYTIVNTKKKANIQNTFSVVIGK